jgi:hypothetical protein
VLTVRSEDSEEELFSETPIRPFLLGDLDEQNRETGCQGLDVVKSNPFELSEQERGQVTGESSSKFQHVGLCPLRG